MDMLARTDRSDCDGRWEARWLNRISQWFLSFRDLGPSEIDKIERRLGELPAASRFGSQDSTELAVRYGGE